MSSANTLSSVKSNVKAIVQNPIMSVEKEYRIVAVLLVSLLSNAGSIVNTLVNNDNIQNNDVLVERRKIQSLIKYFKSLLALSPPSYKEKANKIRNANSITNNTLINSQFGAGGSESIGSIMAPSVRVNVKNTRKTNASVTEVNASHEQAFTSLWKLLAQILLIVFLIFGMYFMFGNRLSIESPKDKINGKIKNKNKNMKVFHPYENDIKWPKLDTVVSQLKSHVNNSNQRKDADKLLFNYYPKTHIDFVQAIQPQLSQFVDEGRINLVHALQLIDKALSLKISINVDARNLKDVLKKRKERSGPDFSFALNDVPADLMPTIRRYYDKLILSDTDGNSDLKNKSNGNSNSHSNVNSKGSHSNVNSNSKSASHIIPDTANASKVKTFFFDAVLRDDEGGKRYYDHQKRDIKNENDRIDESMNNLDGNIDTKTLMDLDSKYLVEMNNYIRSIGDKDIDLIKMYTGNHFQLLNTYLRTRYSNEKMDDIENMNCDGSCIYLFSEFTQQIIHVFKRTSVSDILAQTSYDIFAQTSDSETSQKEMLKDFQKLKTTIDKMFLNSKSGLVTKSRLDKAIRDQHKVHESVQMFMMRYFYDIRNDIKTMILDQIIDDFENIIRNAPKNSKEMFLFRGVLSDTIELKKQLKKGDIISDPAILSTSVDMEVAMHFSRDVIFRIVIPQGSNTLLIPGISEFDKETEALLLPGSRFIVGERRIVPHLFIPSKKITIIDLIHIPEHQSKDS